MHKYDTLTALILFTETQSLLGSSLVIAIHPLNNIKSEEEDDDD
jgi:hypothetical protein